MRLHRSLATIAAATLLAAFGCDNNVIVGPRGNGQRPDPATDPAVQAHWVLDGFNSFGQALGHPTAEVTWLPPASWDQESFRVYSRRTGTSTWFLIATVTSCTEDGCVYVDKGVTPGNSYEYYLATTNEDTNEEATGTSRVSVKIPVATTPATPLADSAISLDGASFIRWKDGGLGNALWKYIVYVTHVDNTSYSYAVGETDSQGYLDARTPNGHVYGYRIAAVDTLEHVSGLSAEIKASPRPDALGELVYSQQSDATRSGFQFQTSESTSPVVAGSASGAHWRFEVDATNGWRIVPLNGTGIIEWPSRTTALNCGPGADSFCRSVTRAPASGYQTTPMGIRPEYSYVFRLTGSDGQPHYGVIRVAILGSDSNNRQLLILDWAYQTLANDPRLNAVAVH